MPVAEPEPDRAEVKAFDACVAAQHKQRWQLGRLRPCAACLSDERVRYAAHRPRSATPLATRKETWQAPEDWHPWDAQLFDPETGQPPSTPGHVAPATRRAWREALGIEDD